MSRPHVVAVSGAAGCGKSTLGAALAAVLDATLLDGDALHGPLMALLAPQPWPLVRAALYEGLRDAAAAASSAGRTVVVVAPFTRERRDAAAWAEFTQRVGATAALVWIAVPGPELIRRLTARGAERDGAKLADPQIWLTQARPEEPPAVPHIRVDGRWPVDRAATVVLAQLRNE